MLHHDVVNGGPICAFKRKCKKMRAMFEKACFSVLETLIVVDVEVAELDVPWFHNLGTSFSKIHSEAS